MFGSSLKWSKCPENDNQKERKPKTVHRESWVKPANDSQGCPLRRQPPRGAPPPHSFVHTFFSHQKTSWRSRVAVSAEHSADSLTHTEQEEDAGVRNVLEEVTMNLVVSLQNPEEDEL